MTAQVCGRLLVGQGDDDTSDPLCQKALGHAGSCSPALDLLTRQGEARLTINAAIRELREAVDVACVEDGPRHRKAGRLNNLAHHVSVAVRDYGRLL
jgi:hypothetical protein